MSTQVTTPDSRPFPVRDPASPPGEALKARETRRKSYPDISTYLKNTCKAVEREDSKARLDILKQQNRCQAYYDDRQNGDWNDRGEWVPAAYDPDELVFTDNRYKEQIDKLLMEMARSYTELVVEPTDPTDSGMREAAEFIKSRVDANRKRLFVERPQFVLSEDMALLLKTLTYRYTYFDKQAEDGPKEKVPQFGSQVFGEEKSLTVCADCGTPRQGGVPDNLPDRTYEPRHADFGACPQCDSPRTRTISTSPVELTLPAGEEEAPCGLVRCVHVDPLTVQVSLNARDMDIRSTPYLVWTQTVERGKLERMFPDAVIPASDGDPDEAGRVRRENETAVSNSQDYSGGFEAKGGEQFERLRFKLTWLDPWIYGDYVDGNEKQLPGGQTLPANTPLIKLFPEGVCVARVGETVLALYGEDKNQKWSVCVFGVREHAFHGSGTNALITAQNNINDLLSYRMTNVYFNTARREFFDQDKIGADHLPPVNKACGVTNLGDAQQLPGAVYGQAPGIPLPAEVPELAQEQYGSLQEQAGTSSLMREGTSAEALSTATGIAAMRDLAVGRIGPNLMLKAAMEVETAFQILEHEQKNYSPQHLFSLAGLRPDRPAGNLGYTSKGVETFINCDLRASVRITPVQGSWMPVTEQEKKADAMAFAEAAQKITDPEILSNIAKTFKQPLQVGGSGPTEREAARRLEEFGRVARIMVSKGFTDASDRMAQVILDSASDARMSVEMDDHQAFIKYHREWWASDEARNAPPVLKNAMRLRTIEHMDASVQNAQDVNARTVESQIPLKFGQLASDALDARNQGQPTSQQKIAESMSYKDLPPDVQQQMIVAAGFQPSKELEAGDSEARAETASTANAMSDREHQATVEIGKQAASNELSRQDREHALQTKAADRANEVETKRRVGELQRAGQKQTNNPHGTTHPPQP